MENMIIALFSVFIFSLPITLGAIIENNQPKQIMYNRIKNSK